MCSVLKVIVMVFLYSEDSIFVAEKYVAEEVEEDKKFGDLLELRFDNTDNNLVLSSEGKSTIFAPTTFGQNRLPEDVVLKNSFGAPANQTVFGDIEIAGNLICNRVTATSDERFKENMVEVVDLPLSSLKTYSYILGGKRCFGIKAQEAFLQPDLSPLVEETKWGLSVDYNGLTALLLERVNSLEKKLEKLCDP